MEEHKACQGKTGDALQLTLGGPTL